VVVTRGRSRHVKIEVVESPEPRENSEIDRGNGVIKRQAKETKTQEKSVLVLYKDLVKSA